MHSKLHATFCVECGASIWRWIEISSSFAKEFLSFQLFLYSKFQSNQDEFEIPDCVYGYNADQISEHIKGFPEVISHQVKFALSLSSPFLSKVESINIDSSEVHFNSLAKALAGNFPLWYTHYIWNQLAIIGNFLVERNLDPFGPLPGNLPCYILQTIQNKSNTNIISLLVHAVRMFELNFLKLMDGLFLLDSNKLYH